MINTQPAHHDHERSGLTVGLTEGASNQGRFIPRSTWLRYLNPHRALVVWGTGSGQAPNKTLTGFATCGSWKWPRYRLSQTPSGPATRSVAWARSRD